MLANLAQVFELTMTPQKFASLPRAGRVRLMTQGARLQNTRAALRHPPRGAAAEAHGAAGLRGPGRLTGVAPPMALFAVFIVVPMLGAWRSASFAGTGWARRTGRAGPNWAQFVRDPLARPALIVTAKVVVLQLGGADADLAWRSACSPRAGSGTGRSTRRCTCCRCCCPRRASR